MASIYKRKESKGWRAVVRIKDYPTVCNHFDRKQEAEDWAHQVEREIKLGQFKFNEHKKLRTFEELKKRFIQDGVLEHHRSRDDTLRHLNYWKSRLSSYALVHITTELISKERKTLLETPSVKGKVRTSATVNRYIATLSTLLTYAIKLKWINENPCFSLHKLKENPGRDRVLSEDEITRLLEAARQSKSPYLHCIILLSLTTGARQGELLNLEWRHVDLKRKIAFIKESKNGRPQSIALCAPAIEELAKLYQNRETQKPLVFACKTAFGRVDLKKAWQQALKKGNIINCRAHDMRHTFCTYAASLGASNLQLQTATGHRTLNMLLHYTHMDAEVTKEFSSKISSQILKQG